VMRCLQYYQRWIEGKVFHPYLYGEARVDKRARLSKVGSCASDYRLLINSVISMLGRALMKLF
jgi:hypothetical protein